MSRRKQKINPRVETEEELLSLEEEQPSTSETGRRLRVFRANESDESRNMRQQKNKEIRRRALANETPEQSNQRKAKDAANKVARRTVETTDENIARLQSISRCVTNLRHRRSEWQDARIEANSIEEVDIPEYSVGEMNEVCQFCEAKHFAAEKPQDGKFTVCCSKSSVKLPPITTNEYIEKLMTGQDPDSKIFMDEIRSYNAALAFVSVGAKFNAPPGFGPYCFRVQGQMYHLSGTLHPTEGDNRRYAQLYVVDEQTATTERLKNPANKKCREHVMNKLAEIMRNNQYAKAYKMMFEVEQEQRSKLQTNQAMPAITMAIVQNRDSDQRRYNPQRCNEVAMVFVSSDGEPPIDRDMLVHLRPDGTIIPKTRRVDYRNKNLDSLAYPILFPNGEQTWGTDIALYNPRGQGLNARQRVTLKQYYSYYLQIRDEFNPILRAGRLTQQFIVDCYVKAEANDLNYVRMNQTKLRIESYKDLRQHAAQVDADAELAGKQVILPSTFSGSSRNMQQNYQDAMAIVRRHGKPDLFITMTCNPKWEEIQNCLEPGERPENRPDLVCRVFYLKLKSFIDEVVGKEIFGKVKAYVYVIEFQKRGLPHAHMLFILTSEHKPRTSEEIDRIVCAELPDELTHPRLFKIVSTNMVHGPCGEKGPSCPCMMDGKCTKSFPKPFQNETIGNMDGYPVYKRRKYEAVQVGKHKIDNSWVVPYNPYLSLRYNCHINVEICASIRSIKYLFKYIMKGGDGANINIRFDEIQTHIDSRYVSPPEAIWRIFKFPMHKQSHNVMRLAVHLDGYQTLTYKPGEENVQRSLELAEERDTTLTAWFKLNINDETARQYKYFEIPEHYVFNEKQRKWTPRQRGQDRVIGRIQVANIKDKERYFLRLLLLHSCGATSFEHLKTVGRQQFASFFEAAKAKGLTTDETVWEETLTEASGGQMPRNLRDLFAYICIFSGMCDMIHLWESHRESLIEDYCRAHGHIATQICERCDSKALRDIEEVLKTHGKFCKDFNLKTPDRRFLDDVQLFDAEAEQAEANAMEVTLNTEQKLAFDKVVDAVYDGRKRAKCFFLDGPGGSGKTYLYKTLLCHIRGKADSAIVVASTGIAANLLKGGRTYHSQFKIPLDLNETSVSGVKPTSKDADIIRNAKLIIWDEATMTPALALQCVDRLLREIMGEKNIPFGGKVLMLGGDFRQCLPVIPKADAAQVVQSCLKYSHLWSCFEQLKLKNNVRSVDPLYSDWLLELGNGAIRNIDGLPEDLVEIPSDMLTKDDIVTDTFGKTITPENVESLSTIAILSPLNEEVDKINGRVLDILEGEEKTYLSFDSLVSEDNDDTDDYPIEFLNSLTPSGSAPHELKIKVGAVVMLLRNLNTKRGLCNGTRLKVIEMKRNLIFCKVLSGTASGDIVFLPRIDLTTKGDLPFELKRKQFPIKLAFAMTINKSQGQTLDRVGIFLPNPVFSHGQLYVAFSRVRKSTDAKIHVTTTKDQGKIIENEDKVLTRNVIYKSVLTE